MPEQFKWDFSEVFRKRECGTVGCAIGLARFCWPDEIWSDEVDYIAGWFGISKDEVDRLFWSTVNTYGQSYDSVTPVMVAEAIDHFLATDESCHPSMSRLDG